MATGGTVERFGYMVDLTKELGRGAFGTVYKGTGGPVGVTAMKKVSKVHRRNASRESMQYYKMKKHTNQPNIVRIYDVRNGDDSMWITMEYCDLGDLNKFFRANKNLIKTTEKKIRMAFDVMVDIANGLAFLHDKKIAHRDIKPANILMKSTSLESQPYTAKLGDFGLSKILDPKDMTSAMSSDVGTLAFKAPEFWDRKPGQKIKYYRNVDIYAAGLTFAAMLQARPEKDLTPLPRCKLETPETYMTIGLLAHTRQDDINLADNDSRGGSETLWAIIQDMTRTSRNKRISAKEVLKRVCETDTARSEQRRRELRQYRKTEQEEEKLEQDKREFQEIEQIQEEQRKKRERQIVESQRPEAIRRRRNQERQQKRVEFAD